MKNGEESDHTEINNWLEKKANPEEFICTFYISLYTHHIWVQNKTWKNVYFIYYRLSYSGTLGSPGGALFLKWSDLYIISIYKMFLVNDDEWCLYCETEPGKGRLHVVKWGDGLVMVRTL